MYTFPTFLIWYWYYKTICLFKDKSFKVLVKISFTSDLVDKLKPKPLLSFFFLNSACLTIFIGETSTKILTDRPLMMVT